MLTKLVLPHKFQFHKGTIKTYKSGGVIEQTIKFQFHKGTIKTHDHQQQNA